MARAFQVHPAGTPAAERWDINPLNVTVFRPVQYQDPTTETEKNGVEILFVNTAGSQSSMVTDMSMAAVREQFNDALRG